MSFDILNDKMKAIQEVAQQYPIWYLAGGSIELVIDVFLPFAALVGTLNLLDYLGLWNFPQYEWLRTIFGIDITNTTNTLTRVLIGYIVLAVFCLFKLAIILLFALGDTNYWSVTRNAEDYH